MNSEPWWIFKMGLLQNIWKPRRTSGENAKKYLKQYIELINKLGHMADNCFNIVPSMFQHDSVIFMKGFNKIYINFMLMYFMTSWNLSFCSHQLKKIPNSQHLRNDKTFWGEKKCFLFLNSLFNDLTKLSSSLSPRILFLFFADWELSRSTNTFIFTAACNNLANIKSIYRIVLRGLNNSPCWLIYSSPFFLEGKLKQHLYTTTQDEILLQV